MKLKLRYSVLRRSWVKWLMCFAQTRQLAGASLSDDLPPPWRKKHLVVNSSNQDKKITET